ncbi:MAG TPA: glycosyltransferase [Methylomirabilota bacterium]|jgi:hypothetical protein|nr:glycosyltransferase [Methylomirabilota bacterium]
MTAGLGSVDRIFVGYERKQDLAYQVLVYSLRKHASRPLDIRPLELAALGLRRPFDPLASTEFTYTRFLVPALCGFAGRALYMDCDMLCLADVTEVLDLDLRDHWLRVVHHDHRPTSTVKMDGRVQTAYPRKNWSSVMLLDCSKLTMWSVENVETRSPQWLHRFEPIPDERIGELPPQWNVLDRYDADTKLIHYTDGGPWLPNRRAHPYGDVWFRYAKESGAELGTDDLRS